MDYKKIIANNIAELRKDMSLTQAELAEKLNYSDKAVSKWERGESIPDVVVLKEVADLFGVSLDYLLEEEHSLAGRMMSVPWQKKKNRFLVTALSCALVFLIATLVFVALGLLTDLHRIWLAYVYCVPLCSILLIVFNSIWGKNYRNYYFISLLMWSFLASVYLTVGNYHSWLLFIIGVPGQIIIIMWSFFKARFFMKSRNKNS